MIPTIHLSADWLGVVDPVSRPAREACVFLSLMGLGGLAILHQRYLKKEDHVLRARTHQAEKLETIGTNLPAIGAR